MMFTFMLKAKKTSSLKWYKAKKPSTIKWKAFHWSNY